MNNFSMRNDKLLKKRFDVLKVETAKKYADDPMKAKREIGNLSTTALVLSGLWWEFYEQFKYDSSWLMTTMGKTTPFIKSFSNEHLKNVSLEDLPNDVITLFVIPENNSIEIIIGTSSVATIKVIDSIAHVGFNKDKKFELSEFVKEHVKIAIAKIDRLLQTLDAKINDQIDIEEEDESDCDMDE